MCGERGVTDNIGD